ncbi:hypothetical protein BASA81_012845 [Batrachochytrium salamandrivorans]|nr:hypothetical protein BASA81_012845 [Batrachochytrium salamandrivorans]
MVIINQLETPKRITRTCSAAGCDKQIELLEAQILRLQQENAELLARKFPVVASNLVATASTTVSSIARLLCGLASLPGVVMMATSVLGLGLLLDVSELVIIPTILFWMVGFNWLGCFQVLNHLLYAAYLLFWSLFVGKVFESIYENL